MAYGQLAQRTYELEKQPRGDRPVFSYDLAPHEQIVGIQHYWTRDLARRQTVDHYIAVWVAVDLGSGAE